MTLADSVLVDKGMEREEREGKLASIDQNRMMSTDENDDEHNDKKYDVFQTETVNVYLKFLGILLRNLCIFL